MAIDQVLADPQMFDGWGPESGTALVVLRLPEHTLHYRTYITLHYITLHYRQTDRQTDRLVCLHSYVPTNIHASHLHACRHLHTYTCACVSCRAFPHSLCGPSACAGRRYEPEIAFTGWNFGQTEETGALAVTKIAVRSRSSGTPPSRRLSAPLS
jgi:hypothetical protein